LRNEAQILLFNREPAFEHIAKADDKAVDNTIGESNQLFSAALVTKVFRW
jgi:hypothetical protein